MGLDITAYRKLTPAPDAAREDGCVVDWENYADFHQRTLDWTDQHWPEHRGDIQAGAYSFAEKFRFRAGSYGGYNEWRDWLARVSGWESAKTCWESGKTEGPFFELIHFADNEGVIGAKVAAKLAKDFAEHADKAGDQGWYGQQYKNWRKAFEMAADSGAVDFH